MGNKIQEFDALEKTPQPENGGHRIERRTLHDAVISGIRDMIIEGGLPTGERIHEGKLGQLLGVSRTPLREALKVLAMEGLVELIPSRGAIVNKLTAKDAKDMLSVLINLEQMAGPLACRNATAEDVDEIKAIHKEMVKLYKARKRLPYFKLNQLIHTRLIELSGNASLSLVHEILQSRMKRIRFLGDSTEESWADAVRDHEEMIQALEQRDEKRLSTAMTSHLDRTWERILHTFEA